MICSNRQCKWQQLLVIVCFLEIPRDASAICIDQSPFWFSSQPSVEPLYDDAGEMLSNKLRVNWGAMHNFKCVDYFQVEYYQKLKPSNTRLTTPRIDRFRRYYDIDIEPCTEYVFKIAASEDYQGRREDFKAFSSEVSYKLDYTPRFTSMPSVKELKIRKDKRGRSRGKRSYWNNRRNWNNPVRPQADQQDNQEEEEEKEPVMIRVTWGINQIDYPTCLDYFVVDYYDITYNESAYSKTIERPFPGPKIDVDIRSDIVPCDPEFRYIVRVFGLTGAETQSEWTPPSCVLTTPPPTTTQKPQGEVGLGQAETLEGLLAENDQIRAKIEGLNEEYAKIGLEVFKAFTEDFFTGLEAFVEGRHDPEPVANGTLTDE